jgi:hypothetical protein
MSPEQDELMRANISYALRFILLFLVVCAFVLGSVVCAKRESGAHKSSEQKNLPKIVPSSLLSLVARRKKEQPGISPKELVAYANMILAHEGFDYEFDLCEVAVGAGKPGVNAPGTSPPKTYLLPMTSVNGEKITFRIAGGDNMEGLCGQCFFRIPCLNVTRQDMLIVSKGRQYHLKRSKQMLLDEMSLVDDTMKRALRTWQVPYDAVPVGISQDGRKLYLDLTYEGKDDDAFGKLILEISETGLRIEARDEVKLKEGEWIKEHPTDPKNAYLSFMRFRVEGQTYIVRFSAPCT